MEKIILTCMRNIYRISMSHRLYSEIRESLRDADPKNINTSSLKDLYRLFHAENSYYSSLEHPNYNKHHYHQRSLFSTLSNYTSTNFFINRLSDTERIQVKKLIELITIWFKKRFSIKFKDFDLVMAVGSILYPDAYREDLQQRLDSFNKDNVITEKKNTSKTIDCNSRTFILMNYRALLTTNETILISYLADIILLEIHHN